MGARRIDLGKALLRSEAWKPQKASRTRLDEFREPIFNLRFNRTQSLTSIKRFLKSEGITTSTAAISKFIKTRFPSSIVNMEKEKVARLLEKLRKGCKG